jgi:hypothetical protein
MAPIRGEIWETKDPEDEYALQHVFICGVQNEWVWYTHISFRNRHYIGFADAWLKARIVEFERKYIFSKHVITTRAYWKKKATGELTQVVGIKDNGWNAIHIYYDLNKIDLHHFIEYFEPATKEEVLRAIAAEASFPKNEETIKRRIGMEKGDLSKPVEYEKEPPCQDK